MKMPTKLLCYLLLIATFNKTFSNSNEFCSSKSEFCDDNATKIRYLLYDVNPQEGFNLRRDVYLRYAVFAHKLKKSTNPLLHNFKLVLPPWSRLYHWKYNDKPEHIPWSYYFDIKSLQLFAPVIDMHTFFEEIGVKYTKIKIDEIYVLQHFEDMFKTGDFKDKWSIEECNKPVKINYFHFNNITANNISCLSFHGHTSQLSQILKTSTAKSILIHHAEVSLHDRFGDATYWKARRSMRFNKELINIADKFRQKYLNSIDVSDNTLRPNNWLDEKARRDAKGGPYLAVHLRRRDFVLGRPEEVPSIESAAKQIEDALKLLNLQTVFVATDAPASEIKKLESLLNCTVFTYKPSAKILNKYKDGGVAIIEQIICSYARYFIGTFESTFSFRIQEEREIIGFPIASTFNRFCGSNKKCDKPSQWIVVY